MWQVANFTKFSSKASLNKILQLHTKFVGCSDLSCTSSSSSRSSSSTSPDNREALAIKYGGSSPIAVPAPYEKNRVIKLNHSNFPPAVKLMS